MPRPHVLSNTDIASIRRLRDAGYSRRRVAALFGVHSKTVAKHWHDEPTKAPAPKTAESEHAGSGPLLTEAQARARYRGRRYEDGAPRAARARQSARENA